MSSVNKVILVGNLGKDPEMRSTQDGKRIANFTVATSETWKDRTSGERKEKTEWHRVTVFNEGLAGIVEKYLRKGSKVYLEGSLQTRKWTDQSGQDRYTTEVVLASFNGTLKMLDSANRNDGGQSGGDSEEDYSGAGPATTGTKTGGRPAYRAPKPGGAGYPNDDLNDEIPFITADLAFEPNFRKRIVA